MRAFGEHIKKSCIINNGFELNEIHGKYYLFSTPITRSPVVFFSFPVFIKYEMGLLSIKLSSLCIYTLVFDVKDIFFIKNIL